MARTVHSTKSGCAKTSNIATQAGARRSQKVSLHANMKAKRSVRKGKKLNVWLESRMKSAIEEFHQGEHGLRHIARAWDVPKSTLARRVKGSVTGYKHASGHKPVLPPSAENELSELITTLSARGFPLARKDIQQLAYQYAQQHNLKGFNVTRGSAGYYWLKGFMQRHNELSVRKPESLSCSRASGLNKTVIDNWFDQYEKTLDDLQIKECPAHIWNTDESGLQDHFVSASVIAEKGKPCYEVNPAEKGETTTVLATFNAVGTYAPLLFIFKGKRLKAEWCIGAPTDSLVKMSENGWITSELFVEFGKKFVSFLPKDDPKPHLLLLDGHCTHVYNLEFLNTMKDNNVHQFCFPPHTTHCLQPADVSLFKSLKHHWTVQGRKHLRQTGGRKPDKKQFFKLFEAAWREAATVATAQSGFRESGTFPVNRNAIRPEVFEPSKTSDRPLNSASSTSAKAPNEPDAELAVTDPMADDGSLRATDSELAVADPMADPMADPNHPMADVGAFGATDSELAVADPVADPMADDGAFGATDSELAVADPMADPTCPGGKP